MEYSETKPTMTMSMSATSAGAVDQLNHIATLAYYKAEARGFEPGQELNDWLEAEAEHHYREGNFE